MRLYVYWHLTLDLDDHCPLRQFDVELFGHWSIVLQITCISNGVITAVFDSGHGSQAHTHRQGNVTWRHHNSSLSHRLLCEARCLFEDSYCRLVAVVGHTDGQTDRLSLRSVCAPVIYLFIYLL